MNYFDKIIGDIETHALEGIRECFANGINPNDHFRGMPLIDELVSGYMRSSNFRQCVKVFVDHGLIFEDKPLLSVLLDDDSSLRALLKDEPALINKRYTLRSAFTPLYEVTLMHICAEFNHVHCAMALVAAGADVNAKAGLDDNGFGGQTPIFHTVNQVLNHAVEMLHFLLDNKADLNHAVKGITWGKGYEWETFIPSVNPLSYAMMGLLPQMHRNERAVSETVSLLLKAAYGINYTPPNVPNKYLQQ
ncbi:MAG: ankyrin repeat domain-containing protein [Ferruginibacter sp.]